MWNVETSIGPVAALSLYVVILSIILMPGEACADEGHASCLLSVRF
jgi:hypothetical protein